MRVWIANTTKQNHHFQYRPRIARHGAMNPDGTMRPTHGDLRRYEIPLGGQICLEIDEIKAGDSESIDQLKEVFSQHPKILPFKDLVRVKGYQGLCYKVGGDQIPVERILGQIEENDKARAQVSKERQKETAQVIATNMRLVSNEGGTPFRDLRETDVQISQVSANEVNGGTPKLNAVVEVTEPGKEPSGRARKSAG